MGGVGMPQSMDGHAHLGNAGTVFGSTEGPLDTAPTHRRKRRWTVVLIPPGSRKEPRGVPVGFPVGAEQRQRLGGQRDVPVLGALPAMDMDLETLAIDVRAPSG